MKEKDLRNSLKYSYNIDDSMFTIQEYDLDYENNEIFLMGAREYSHGAGGDWDGEPGVEHIMAGRFIKNLQILMKKEGNEPIVIHMKTCGGHWAEGMAIYDIIKSCPNPITILSYTHARSMSSLIFLAANKRVMMPSSTFMYHHGSMGMDGTVTQYLTEGVELEKTKEYMLDIYMNSMKKQGKFSKWGKKRIKDYLLKQMAYKEEVYLSPKEAIEYGFADEIFDGNWDNLREYTESQLEIE